jgi:hypothetical protein
MFEALRLLMLLLFLLVVVAFYVLAVVEGAVTVNDVAFVEGSSLVACCKFGSRCCYCY